MDPVYTTSRSHQLAVEPYPKSNPLSILETSFLKVH